MGDNALVRCVTVWSARHVHAIDVEFSDGTAERVQGEPDVDTSALALGRFELAVAEREFLVRVEGRQGKRLDGVQFVSNLGRRSEWFGGAGGSAFLLAASAGSMLVGLETADAAVAASPKVLGVVEAAAPAAAPRVRITKLLLHRNVRRLALAKGPDGSPSLARGALQGRPSVLRLVLKRRAIMARVMLRGKTSFLRLLLDGEQRKEPASLFRRMCSPPPGAGAGAGAGAGSSAGSLNGGLSMMQLLQCRDRRERHSRSLAQLLLMGSPSVARQFFGKRRKSPADLMPLAQLLFERDEEHGFPSLTHVLTTRDQVGDVAHLSVLEAVLRGEESLRSQRRVVLHGKAGEKANNADLANPARPGAALPVAPRDVSLLRLLLMGESATQKSLLGYLLAGEREGRPSLMRRFVEDKDGSGISVARMLLTSFDNHKGHRPALATYIIGGELDLDDDGGVGGASGRRRGRDSILRMMLAGEARARAPPSLLRLLLIDTKKKRRPGLFRGMSSRRRLRERARESESEREGGDGEGGDVEGGAVAVAGPDTGTRGKQQEKKKMKKKKKKVGGGKEDEDVEDDDDDDDDDDDEEEEEEDGEEAGPRRGRRQEQQQQGASAEASAPERVEKRSLMDIMTAGTPSIAELFFEGELRGEDSLARLMLGTSVSMRNGILVVGSTLSKKSAKSKSKSQEPAANMSRGDKKRAEQKAKAKARAKARRGVSLFQMMLAGEEEGGPGISMLRLMLFGENDNGRSLLRLLLLNEGAEHSDPSLLRILMTTLKAALVAAKTRPSHFRDGEWKEQVAKIGKTIAGSQREGATAAQTARNLAAQLRSGVERLAGALNPAGEQFQEAFRALRSVSQRGGAFQTQWRAQWERIAVELELAGERAGPDTVWRKMGPKWRDLALLVARQRWTQLATDVAVLASSFAALERWTEKARKARKQSRTAGTAAASWAKTAMNVGRLAQELQGDEDSDDDDDDDDDDEEEVASSNYYDYDYDSDDGFLA